MRYTSEFQTLWRHAAAHRATLSFCLALMLGESAAALALPWAAGVLTQGILDAQGAGRSAAGAMLGLMLALFALQAVLRFGRTYVLGNVADRIISDLKVGLYDHLQALPLAYFQERRLGDTLALLTSDVYVVGGFISGTALALLPLLLTSAGAVALMVRIDPVLALLAGALIPLFYFALKLIGRRMRPLALRVQEEYANAIALAEENLGMLPAIKIFTRESMESMRYRAQIERIYALNVAQRRLYAALEPAAQFVAAAGIVLILALASGDLAAGQLAPAQLVSFLLYAALLARPVAELADVYGQTQMARGALARLRSAMEAMPEPRAEDGARLARVKGEIRFENVSFAYPGRAPALDHLDLRIAPGETVAIIGPNGAGKSTLGHLLMRLHEPATGRICIDGEDIASVSLASLRRQIGVVPQHVLLFHASVSANIAYGRPQPQAAQIEAAARAAQAHEFISALPQGYATLIGDRGVRLSGGQQQRLALARALLKDPPILILDEATAMFDPQGEAEFLRTCRDTLAGRTVLLITHRPASLAIADRVLRMEAGRIIAA